MSFFIGDPRNETSTKIMELIFSNAYDDPRWPKPLMFPMPPVNLYEDLESFQILQAYLKIISSKNVKFTGIIQKTKKKVVLRNCLCRRLPLGVIEN